jgi:hypothetical protein
MPMIILVARVFVFRGNALSSRNYETFMIMQNSLNGTVLKGLIMGRKR